jgi:hypothetical protein
MSRSFSVNTCAAMHPAFSIGGIMNVRYNNMAGLDVTGHS